MRMCEDWGRMLVWLTREVEDAQELRFYGGWAAGDEVPEDNWRWSWRHGYGLGGVVAVGEQKLRMNTRLGNSLLEIQNIGTTTRLKAIAVLPVLVKLAMDCRTLDAS